MKRLTLLPIIPVLIFVTLLTAGCHKETTAKDYYQKSFQFINAGQTQDAIDLLTLAISKDPVYFDAYYNRAAMYFCQKKYSLALNDYNRAIELNPQNAGAYAGRGSVYDKMNKADRSLSDFKTAARLGDKETQEHLRSKGMAW